jgi:hypothetical protein
LDDVAIVEEVSNLRPDRSCYVMSLINKEMTARCQKRTENLFGAAVEYVRGGNDHVAGSRKFRSSRWTGKAVKHAPDDWPGSLLAYNTPLLKNAKSLELGGHLLAEGVGRHQYQEALGPSSDQQRQHRLSLPSPGRHDDRGWLNTVSCPIAEHGVHCTELRRTKAR